MIWRHSGEEQKEKLDRTCVPPLVSLQLVGAGELPSAVCELALVGLLAWTRTRRQTHANDVRRTLKRPRRLFRTACAVRLLSADKKNRERVAKTGCLVIIHCSQLLIWITLKSNTFDFLHAAVFLLILVLFPSFKDSSTLIFLRYILPHHLLLATSNHTFTSVENVNTFDGIYLPFPPFSPVCLRPCICRCESLK